MDHAFLDDSNNVLGIDFENLCVLAKAGNDRLSPIDVAAQGRVAVLAGSGNDLVQGAGQDDLLSGAEGDDSLLAGGGADQLFGGAGDDYLCGGDGDDVINGGPGNDTISGGNGANTVVPGPGRDSVNTGAGDDVLYIYDECEISADTISMGAGHDVVISPLNREQLQALGVVLDGVEEVRVERHSCLSQCRTQPDCVVGTCKEATTAGGELSCACPPTTQGARCEEAILPEYTPSVPPSLGNVPAGQEEAAAKTFMDWTWASRVGDVAAARHELDLARNNIALRRAFAALGRKLIAGRNITLALAAIDTVSYLQCRDCETVLREVIEKPMPTGGTPVNTEHGTPMGTEEEDVAIVLKSAAANGLAWQQTQSSKSYLLDQMTVAPASTRVAIAHALSAAYGDSVRSELLARLPAAERLEAYVFPNNASDFSERLAAFRTAQEAP
jgi:hypothetical protein